MAFKSRVAIILCVCFVLGASVALAASVTKPSVEGLKAQAKVHLRADPSGQLIVCNAALSSLGSLLQGQASGWELTLHRQKLRAQALADELGALVEQAARKVLGKSLRQAYTVHEQYCCMCSASSAGAHRMSKS